MDSVEQTRDPKREALLAQVRDRFDDSPLWEVGQLLEDVIADLNIPAIRVADFITSALEALPHSFGRRFTFDAAMLQDIARTWSSDALQLPQTIVPCFGEGWAYSRQPMHPDRLHTHYLELIHLPGDDDLGDVNLLMYPWVCHELGHFILSRPASTFVDLATTLLQTTLSNMESGAGGASGQPGEVALRRIEKCWAPAANPEDWANECAADVVALWTCGSAFIAAMEETAANGGVDPYSIESPHPPYEVRVRAVIWAARFLGLGQAVGRLQAIAQEWEDQRQQVDLAPDYAFLTHPRVIEHAVWAASAACQALGLRPCTPEAVDEVRKRMSATAELDFGIELLLTARLLREEKGAKAYKTWETDTVARLAEDINLKRPD